jgi:hypothetical protein
MKEEEFAIQMKRLAATIFKADWLAKDESGVMECERQIVVWFDRFKTIPPTVVSRVFSEAIGNKEYTVSMAVLAERCKQADAARVPNTQPTANRWNMSVKQEEDERFNFRLWADGNRYMKENHIKAWSPEFRDYWTAVLASTKPTPRPSSEVEAFRMDCDERWAAKCPLERARTASSQPQTGSTPAPSDHSGDGNELIGRAKDVFDAVRQSGKAGSGQNAQ